VEGGEKWARYSFLGTDPFMVLTAKDGRLALRHADGRTGRLPPGNPLTALRELLARFHPVAVPGLPRFQGGAVGYLGYDVVRHLERLPRSTRDDLGLPDAVFLLTDNLLVFDNLRHRLLVIANCHVDKTDPAALDRAYDRAAVKIGMTLAKLGRPARVPAPLTLPALDPLLALDEEGFTSSMDESAFIQAVRRAKHRHQTVLDQRAGLKRREIGRVGHYAQIGAPFRDRNILAVPIAQYHRERSRAAPILFLVDIRNIQPQTGSARHGHSTQHREKRSKKDELSSG